ncbi:GspH/FimT family pseudopilin [Lentisphaera marina]|uniref:GspH/FimT family pseudopilin n=1 Tax=Lentisphaera marina TaxID=1111041 RepID=UPI0023663ED9|nr:GspH/FimT family pseudopilin [Lentisphaera marina]MDD7986874.1 GspH/FimT family pseudopilin [Lentisphaera marina]
MSTPSLKKNFSLVELLAVIAIMSMLIAIVGVAMKPNPVNSAARELSGAINKARSYALAKRKYTLVHITQQEGKFAQIEPIKIFTDNTLTTADNTGTVPGSTVTYLNKGANITASNNSELYISFHPNGGVNNYGNVTNTDVASANQFGNDTKWFVDIQKRGDEENKLRLYINKFTGMVSF